MKSIRLLGATLLASTTLLGAASAFAAEDPNPANAKTPISAVLEVEDTTQPTPPTGVEGGGDEITNISDLFGIAYAPGQLSGTAKLNANGEQKIDLSNNSATKFNVGVKDKTRKNDQNWTLKASLSWDNDNEGYMNGTSIEASGGNVKLNTDGNLGALTNDEVTTSATDLQITSTATTVMSSVKGKTMNGVYNYQFESPKLVIPEVSEVAGGTYSGNINWDLSNVLA